MRMATILVLLISFVQIFRVHGNPNASADRFEPDPIDTIVVVSNDIKVTECIENELRNLIESSVMSLRVAPYSEIRNAFFPWLELRANNSVTWTKTVSDAGEIAKKLISLKTNRVTRPAFEKTGLLYVVRAESHTIIDEEFEGDCGGGFCLGVISGNKETSIFATVWNMTNPKSSSGNKIASRADYSSSVIMLPFPPARPDTEQAACLTVAEGIIDRISPKGMRSR